MKYPVQPEHIAVHDKEKLREFIRQRYEVDVDIKPCRKNMLTCGSSAAALIWITSRIIEKNGFKVGCPVEADDFHCLMTEKGKLYLAPVARSKVFRTNLLPNPIDLTAARVSVCVYSEAF